VQKPADTELVRAARAGDRAAYGRLYDRYAPLVRAVCYDWVRSLADAQDLAQDVFLRAYERLDQLHKPDSFGPWLISIARHRCQEWQRQATRDRRRREGLHEPEDVYPAPQNDGELARLGPLMAGLPETERLALHAFYLQDQSVEEARRIVGLSRAGFYRALERAKKRLRRQLSREQESIQ